MIGIRADANGIIASGHIMRCIAIAEQIENRGESAIFITADHFSDILLDEKGYNHSCLECDWQDKDLELNTLSEFIQERNITILLVDSYQVTKNYLEALHKLVKIAYIDDLYQFEYSVDLLINYAIEVNESAYSGYSDVSMKLLLGPKYTPLRKEFQNNNIQINSEVKNVMITTGGSDNYHIALRLIKRITKMNSLDDICVHVIIGGFFDGADVTTLEKLCSDYKNIVMHKDIKNMAEIMLQCDIAVSAGGTTLAELCSCGIPTICFAIASNQQNGINSYGKHGIMSSMGDVRENINAGVDNIISQIELLKNSQNIRMQYSQKARELIDGDGAGRIADRILQLNETEN